VCLSVCLREVMFSLWSVCVCVLVCVCDDKECRCSVTEKELQYVPVTRRSSERNHILNEHLVKYYTERTAADNIWGHTHAAQ